MNRDGLQGSLLLARNSHKAAYHAAYLRNLQTSYVYPGENVYGINGDISPEAVRAVLEKNPQTAAVLVTSPTYDGVVSDICGIAKVVHEKKAVLIVDEAHGAHLKFSDCFPDSAVDLGADLVIQSFHKTLPALTQAAVLHRCSDLRDFLKRRRARGFFGIYADVDGSKGKTVPVQAHLPFGA